MVHGVVTELVAGLFLWSLISLSASVFGLCARPNDFWRSFWFITGMWGLVDGGIALYALISPPASTTELAPILKVNAGLDVIYIIVGAGLMIRAAQRLRGFGLAILIQGVFLLAFDLFFWWRCTAEMN